VGVGNHLSSPSITLGVKSFDYSQDNSELLFSLDFARDRPSTNMIRLWKGFTLNLPKGLLLRPIGI